MIRPLFSAAVSKLFRQIILQGVDFDAFLRHGIAVANGNRLVFESVEVDSDAERRANLVLTAIELADTGCVIINGAPAALFIRVFLICIAVLRMPS